MQVIRESEWVLLIHSLILQSQFDLWGHISTDSALILPFIIAVQKHYIDILRFLDKRNKKDVIISTIITVYLNTTIQVTILFHPLISIFRNIVIIVIDINIQHIDQFERWTETLDVKPQIQCWLNKKKRNLIYFIDCQIMENKVRVMINTNKY